MSLVIQVCTAEMDLCFPDPRPQLLLYYSNSLPAASDYQLLAGDRLSVIISISHRHHARDLFT